MNQFADVFEKKGIIKTNKNNNQKQKNKQKQPKPNLGWLFYKEYFFDLDYNDIESNEHKIKNKIKNILNSKVTYKNQKNSFCNSSFELTTIYPGLLLGSGYLHELPNVKGQAILGFDFDYTTGLPIIRGSSIKGVLRSAFEHKEYLKELFIDLKIDENLDLKNLINKIFESGNDIFFDAFPIKSKGNILSDDYITPHKDELKNLVPLRFIKVSPEVTFRFEFNLSNEIISSKEKENLFKQIILDFGLGAKTNVGYGKFKE